MTSRETALLWLRSFIKNKEPMVLIPKQLLNLIYDAINEQEDMSIKDKRKDDKKMTREQAAQMIERMPICHECREFFGLALDALRQPEIVLCKNCKWYDERISMCDNCRLPREQTFFCADGKRKEEEV